MMERDLSPLDFTSIKATWIRFSSDSLTDYEWKEYCPAVFRKLQELQNIDYEDYMLSVCDLETLTEVSSPGKAIGMLYLTKDEQFVIKTIRKSEVKVLLEILPNYYRHMRKYGASLLTKFYGLHVMRRVGGAKVYFVVSGNILHSDAYIHLCYDLKGSPQGRTINKAGVNERTTLKDVDFGFSFYLEPLIRNRLLAQIKYDCEFLEAQGLMDYSFLLGMHVEAPQRVFYNRKSLKNTNPELTLADICQQPFRPGFKFGVKMPARAVKTPNDEKGIIEEGFDVSLYFGIIDILQDYNVVKRIEHAYKSLHYDSKLISAVNPNLYSTRFQEFLQRVFVSEDADFC